MNDKHLVILAMTIIAVAAMWRIPHAESIVHDVILALGSIATGFAWGKMTGGGGIKTPQFNQEGKANVRKEPPF